MAFYFEEAVKLFNNPKKIANWLTGAVLKEMNDRKLAINDLKVSPAHLVELIVQVEESVVSNLVGKDVLAMMIQEGKGAKEIIAEKGLAQVSDDGALMLIIDEVIAQNPAVVEQIKSGKPAAAGFLVGQAMKKSGGKANPKKLNELITGRITNA